MILDINTEHLPPMSIQRFGDLFGLRMVVNSRDISFAPEMRLYARFDGVYVVDRGGLLGVSGNGATHEDAIRAYAAEISGKEIVLDLYASDSSPVFVPGLLYDEEV